MATELRDRIALEVGKIKIVDTHEHIALEKDRVAQKVDFFHCFLHYASSDLVSAGMSWANLEEIRNPDRPLEERWRKFAPHWENIKNTAYSKALLIAAKDLFVVEQVNERTVGELSEKIAAALSLEERRYAPATQPLLALARNKEANADLRAKIVGGLHLLGSPKSTTALADIARDTTDKNDIREAALKSLSNMGDEGWSVIEELKADKDVGDTATSLLKNRPTKP